VTKVKTTALRKIWLDTDPGFDDWLTMLLLAANPELDWLGISIAAGNAPLDITCDNALRIKAHYGLQPPIYRGCVTPLNGAAQAETAQCILGQEGMRTNGPALPPTTAVTENMHGVDALIAAIRQHPGQITLLAIAPLTNLATALLQAPDIAAGIKEIILMGGSADQGNHTAAAEFNIYADPEAADVVFRSGVPLRMFGLNLCRQLCVTGAEVAQVRDVTTQRGDWLAGYLDAYQRIRSADGSLPMPMYDPVVALYLRWPDLFEFKPAHVDIELNGRFTRGMTVCEFRVPRRAAANAQIAMCTDGELAMRCLMAELLPALS
jgi:purine nucleosidase